jgi:EAL domain-containing protein (putative c-di-GMP-specific phosphodiesterase class I)
VVVGLPADRFTELSDRPTSDESQKLFIQQMDRELVGWSDPAAHLQRALERDDFELFCQPILSLGAGGGYPIGDIVIRMREEEKAMLPPGEFLPVFEHYGMMPQLDRWVVTHILQHLASGGGLPKYALNLSKQTILDPKFPSFVAEGIALSGAAASALVFEVEEADMIDRLPAVETFARAIKHAGCGLSFDGFGKRSVSFAPLQMLGFDYVKIDGVVTRQLLKSTVAQNKMSAVVRVARVIGLGVIAECIEDDETLMRVKGIGVQYAQGFGVSRPQPIAGVKGAGSQPA